MNTHIAGRVLGVKINALNWHKTIEQVMSWARHRESRYIAICNAHVVVTASRNEEYGRVINGADMATPDGAPVAWMLRRIGFPEQSRINGPDLMWKLCEQAARENVPVYCYGSTETTLNQLGKKLRAAMPSLQITMESPPFRKLLPHEDEAAIARINASGAGIVFVGLGCPKQERWMAERRGNVKSVMIGVGAAFDYHAGIIQRAPIWMQSVGLEWLHRLASEPRRLWKRYMVTNSFFILGATRQLLSRQIGKHR